MQDKLWILYDLAAIVFIFIMISSGWRQGLVKTLINFLGGLIALVAAVVLSVPISQMAYDSLVESKIVNYVDEQLMDVPNLPEASDFLSKLPDQKLIAYIDELLGDIKIPQTSQENESGLSSQLAQSINRGNTTAEAITDVFISPIAKNIIRSIAGLVLFALFSVIIKLIAGLFGEVVGMIPIIGPTNRLLGAAAGGVWALVILCIVVMVLNLFISLFGSNTFINADALHQSYILSKLNF